MSFLESVAISADPDPGNKWDKVFKNRQSKICGRQPLRNLKGYNLLQTDHIPSKSLKAVFHKFCPVHSLSQMNFGFFQITFKRRVSKQAVRFFFKAPSWNELKLLRNCQVQPRLKFNTVKPPNSGHPLLWAPL